jgi:hypothetical protein
LTLVSGKHNSALSNRPWRSESAKGKRDYLLQHSNLKLNAEIVAEHDAAWTEEAIAARTTALTERLLAIWPRPATAHKTVVTADAYDIEPVDEPEEDTEDAGQPSHTGKYRALWRWLRQQEIDPIRLPFAEIEQVLGFALPPSSRLHTPHWHSYDGSAVVRAIRDAGWKVANLSLVDEEVTLTRSELD